MLYKKGYTWGLTYKRFAVILFQLILIGGLVMGACPKNRVSKLRGRKRRTHYKARPVELTKCPQCLETKRAHRVCQSCGYYDKKVKVLEVETE